ncbi:hypothetical protein RND71_007431 [Anisodus tanguticus]|uniref:Uncharacterized protein n=1 Tax=Anisodus tanguticus TaxID=243964 RepID=A0AAE1SMI0_9SOLA|nr:hypothetical protein RND71_007431 [Anisodus tanguticus]
MILTSWLSRRRFRRYLCFLLCSPFLLPLFCATCPIICAAEICYGLCHRRRRSPWKSAEGFDGIDGSVDESEGTLLLRRYLDDQLLLVIESVYNCGDEEEEDEVDVEFIDSRSLLLQ